MSVSYCGHGMNISIRMHTMSISSSTHAMNISGCTHGVSNPETLVHHLEVVELLKHKVEVLSQGMWMYH